VKSVKKDSEARKLSILIILPAFARIASSQGPAHLTVQTSPTQLPNKYPGAIKNDKTALSKFALSINPHGFVQFGPELNTEFGITKNLAFFGAAFSHWAEE
jgi:hypothetical protein